jgi:hypothetical protein
MSNKNQTILNDDVNSLVMETTKKYIEYLKRRIKKVPEFVDFRVDESLIFLSPFNRDSGNIIHHRFTLQNIDTGELRQKSIVVELLPEYVRPIKTWLKVNSKDGKTFNTIDVVKPIVDDFLINKKQKINFHRNWKQYCYQCDRDDFNENEITHGYCINCNNLREIYYM